MLELAPLADAVAIPAALCSVLDVVTQPGQAPIDRITEFLSDRRALLIVDNCEHVLDAAADLVQRLLGPLGAEPREVVTRVHAAVPSLAWAM